MAGSVKWIVRQMLARHGIQVSLSSNNASIEGFLAARQVETVLDVGANIGQFAQQLRNHGFQGRIVSFEPVSSVYKILASNAASDAGWDTRCVALGDASGQATINVSKDTVYSSIVPQTALATQLDGNAATVGTEAISVSTLDQIFPDFGRGRTFLKVDTQGSERSVLAGGKNALKKLVGVQLELPIEHLYRDAWTIDEAIK